MQSTTRGTAKAGFTLVEILVVVVIITILAGLLTAAVFRGVVAAERTRIIVEVQNLKQGVEAFKLEYDYPPDCSDIDVTNAFLQTQFRYRDTVNDILDRNGNGTDDLTEGIISPDEALVLFLSGFSNDPALPLTGGGERRVFFDFDQTRLTDRDGDDYFEYIDQSGENCPYYYFDSRTYLVTVAGYVPQGVQIPGRCAPYRSDLVDQVFAEDNSFQIISAGLDGNYGNPAANSLRSFPSGDEYAPEDRDNITSFSEGTLQDSIP